MLTWTPFAGATDIAQRREARGRELAAQAMADAAEAQSLVEQHQAGDALRVAIARLPITARGVDQAAEAHRIVERKYAGGLATISELLDAAAQETAAALADLGAAYQAIVALAEQRTAHGLDLRPLQALDPRGE
jgi:outer membrane protein TolC